MLLLPDGIGLAQPGAEVLIDLGRRREAKVVHVIARRDRVDAAKPGVREPAGQDEVPGEPTLARSDLCERHAHLKRDAGLFWYDDHRPALGDGPSHGVVQGANRAILAPEVVR